jgi:hypothetical protein
MLILIAVAAAIWLLLGVLAIAACIRSSQLTDPQAQHLARQPQERAA